VARTMKAFMMEREKVLKVIVLVNMVELEMAAD
jgi:hypothetical protein